MGKLYPDLNMKQSKRKEAAVALVRQDEPDAMIRMTSNQSLAIPLPAAKLVSMRANPLAEPRKTSEVVFHVWHPIRERVEKRSELGPMEKDNLCARTRGNSGVLHQQRGLRSLMRTDTSQSWWFTSFTISRAYHHRRPDRCICTPLPTAGLPTGTRCTDLMATALLN